MKLHQKKNTYDYSADALVGIGYPSARSGTPVLQSVVDEKIWLGPGHVDPANVLILIDAMNSGLPRGHASAAADEYVRTRRDNYEKFFQMARQKFHKIIYVKTPPPEFWRISDARIRGVYVPMAEHAEHIAKTYGALVIDGKTHFSTLEKFRKSGDPWHFSSQDEEFCLLWEVLCLGPP